MICPLELADLCAILRDCDDLSLQEREDAAVAIEWLQADNEQMRAALEACVADLKIARTALAERRIADDAGMFAEIRPTDAQPKMNSSEINWLDANKDPSGGTTEC